MLDRHGLDVRLYDSAFNPYPFAVTPERLAELMAIQGSIARGLSAIVQHFGCDRRIREVIRLGDAEMALIERMEERPYRAGAFRPDFLHAAEGRALVNEINARFPLNGFLSSSLLARLLPQLYGGVSPVPGMERIPAALRDRLGAQGTVAILKASEPGWDVNLLCRWWAERCEIVRPEILTAGRAQSFRSILLELHQHELLEQLPDEALEALLAHNGLLNDPRTILVGHDKRLLALLSQSEVIEDYLDKTDVQRLRRHVVPTWVKAGVPDEIRRAMASGRGWLAKPPRSGKGKGILVSDQYEPGEWREKLERLPDDWVIQPYVTQATFAITVARDGGLVTKPMKVVGLLPTLDDELFGPGMYRAASDDLVNVARGRTILAPVLLTAETGERP